jgi:hypothetical protein
VSCAFFAPLQLNLATEVVTPDGNYKFSSEFENNNTKADLVKDVKLKELHIDRN